MSTRATRAQARANRTQRVVSTEDYGDSFTIAQTQGGHSYWRQNGLPGIVISQGGTFRPELPSDEEDGAMDTETNQPPSAPSEASVDEQYSAIGETPDDERILDGGTLVNHKHGRSNPSALSLSFSEASAAAVSDVPAPDQRVAAHLSHRQAHSKAARRAIMNQPDHALAAWALEDVLEYDPERPPSCIMKTRGSKTAFFLVDGRQVKEVWRCLRCDARRVVDPNVTTALSAHLRRTCPGS